MSFPDKNWLGFPKGWVDLGFVGSYVDNKTNDSVYGVCGFCQTRLKLGREKEGELFRFCGRCLKVTKNY